MTDSQRLLAEYVQTGADAAFRELVTRYVGLVYSTARRLVDGDTHRAEDVAQIVFVDLARTARTLPGDVLLGGWLHRHTCFVAAKTMRGERRRQSRERQAVEMNALHNDSGPDYSGVAPILDEAIDELGEEDRTAILLRFFEQHDFRSVGQALGVNEDAARMRVNRALEKLQDLIKPRGVTTSAAALSVVLSANAVQAAPVGLSATITTAAAFAGTAIATTATATATKAIAMTTLQKAIIGATVIAVVGTGIYEARQTSTLRTQNLLLQQQQAPLNEQNQRLQRDRDAAASKLAASQQENERLRRDTAELAKLRGEVARLGIDARELAQLRAGLRQRENDLTSLSLKSWVERANQLKQRLEQTPDKRIPELQFLTETDWLEAVRNVNVETEIEARQALNALRNVAKEKVASVLSEALKKYGKANEGKFPADLAQLKAYFESQLDDSILERYSL